jgi:hypothetical protein
MSSDHLQARAALLQTLTRTPPLPVEQVWLRLTAQQQQQVLQTLVQACQSLLKGRGHNPAKNEGYHDRQ